MKRIGLGSRFLVRTLLLLATASASAQQVLPDGERTNGAKTLQVLAPVQASAAGSQVLVGRDREHALEGVVVGQEGYILTQASDTTPLKPLRVHLRDGTSVDAREVRRETALNLLLLKIERTGLSPVIWGESLTVKAGQWLCALAEQGREIRMGVLSAQRRSIADTGAVLGVRFGPGEDKDTGVYIEEVAEDGPANHAGLLAEDVIVSINDQAVQHPNGVRSIVSTYHPGDALKIKYLRVGEERECEVLLASKSHVFMNWSGEDYANFGTSIRTDNFPQVLQHDLPLTPEDMGGALYTLEGNAVGLNISRVDRVTNYALPVEIFLPKLREWIKADREKK